jgi:glycosyltransferase involved in cell wall biosynthesis
MNSGGQFDPATDVVMPLRGPQPWIEQCLASLAAQAVAPTRVIIVDDGIADRFAVEELGKRLLGSRLLVLPNEGNGVAAAINTGVSHSRSAWIMRIDGDDAAHPQRLQIQLECLRAAWPRMVGCGTQARLIDRGGRLLGRLDAPSDPGLVAKQIWKRNIFLGPTMVVRRELLAAHPFRPLLGSCEDYDSALQLLEHGDLCNVPHALLDYRVHPNQQSFERRVRQTILAEITVRAALRRQRGDTDPVDATPHLVEEFVQWRMREPGYAPLRRMLTALRYANLHLHGKDFAESAHYLSVAARSAVNAAPAYWRIRKLVQHGYWGLAQEPSPLAGFNV